MEGNNYGHLIGGAVLWAIGLLLLVEAVSTQWAGGMSAMGFVYYLIAFVLFGIGWQTCCTKFICAPAKK